MRDIMIESFYSEMKDPYENANYEESLNTRNEVIKECPECDGEGYFEDISDCCGADRDEDTGLCHDCHDHCGPSECPECNGTGILK